ncbi:hypothetical protein JCM14469_26080 [Desulfatiferula olefinivorans]
MIRQYLDTRPVSVSAPCRLDMGGTLDISTFFFPLRHRDPTTVNIALDMRTQVSLSPWTPGKVAVSSRGFDSVEFDCGQAPYSHPLGLMLSICDYFHADGVHIDIRSSSPPRSALGGSSVAAVALIAALMIARGDIPENGPLPLDAIVLLAYAVESSVLRVPCGMQDQLAAAYGGVNAWRFTGDVTGSPWERRPLLSPASYPSLEGAVLAAYGGDPHESVNINGKWVSHFMAGKDRTVWFEILDCCNGFADALAAGDYLRAAEWMNRETDLRVGLTPDVFDETGRRLAELARAAGCGVRFTGAGGGGCVWALGEPAAIATVKNNWGPVLRSRPHADFLSTVIAAQGLRVESPAFD